MDATDATEVRPLTKDDIADVVAFARAENRNWEPREMERFFELEGAHGVVARRNGRLIGAVTVIRYFDHAFLGPLLVESDATSVGLALLSEAIEGIQRRGVGRIETEATLPEAVVLEGLGFERLHETRIMERDAAPKPAGTATVPLGVFHYLDLGALDGAAVGYGRKEYVCGLCEDFPEGARAVEKDGELQGYAVLRRARRGYHLGPVVTVEGADHALPKLIADAVAAAATWPIVTLVAEDSPAQQAFESEGFREVGRLVRMRAGNPAKHEADQVRATEWAIGGRLTG